MTYTVEQLRERARNLRANGHPMGAHECEAHADALEERDAALSAAKAESEVADIWREKAKRAEAELAKLRGRIVAADAHLRFVAEYREQYEAWPCVEAISGSIECARDILRADFPEETK